MSEIDSLKYDLAIARLTIEGLVARTLTITYDLGNSMPQEAMAVIYRTVAEQLLRAANLHFSEHAILNKALAHIHYLQCRLESMDVVYDPWYAHIANLQKAADEPLFWPKFPCSYDGGKRFECLKNKEPTT